MNALDAEHYRALSEAWIRVRDDADIRVAIVTGAGEKSFSTGADLKSFANNPAPLSEMWLTQREQMWNRILRVTDDAAEGPLAFAEKRPARFQGR